MNYVPSADTIDKVFNGAAELLPPEGSSDGEQRQ